MSEAVGGGLEAAIRDFCRSTPEFDHVALLCRRGDFATGDADRLELRDVEFTESGWNNLAKALPRAYERFQPDIVHLHSAWAGLVGRVLLGRERNRIVYSPHSFYFDRMDSGRLQRSAARALERALAPLTAEIAAVSPHELAEAEAIGARGAYVPNIVRVHRQATPRIGESADPNSVPELVSIGRLHPQKDPEFLLAVKRAYDRAGHPAVHWTWLGSGSSEVERQLLAGGIDVVPWMPREGVIERLSQAAVYVHTAAWEGSPITLLEARALGVPVVVRSIPATSSLGYPEDLTTPDRVAEQLRQVLHDPSVRERSITYPPVEGEAEQRSALLDVYRRVLAER